MINIAFISILAFLALATYFSKRRFGLLGLSLVAGSVISTYATDAVTKFLQSNDITITFLPMNVVVSCGLIILPLLVLFFVGHTYKKKYQRIACALAVAATAGLFILLAVRNIAPDLLAGQESVTDNVFLYQGVLIIVVTILALLDSFHGHLPAKFKRKK